MKDKHHDDKLIVTSVVLAVIITKLGDVIIQDPFFNWLNFIPNENLRGFVAFILFIVILVMITIAILQIIKWVTNQAFKE